MRSVISSFTSVVKIVSVISIPFGPNGCSVSERLWIGTTVFVIKYQEFVSGHGPVACPFSEQPFAIAQRDRVNSRQHAYSGLGSDSDFYSYSRCGCDSYSECRRNASEADAANRTSSGRPDGALSSASAPDNSISQDSRSSPN
jgi:hypothetical protein